MGEHPRLARARAGDHEQRPTRVHDGIELGGVQAIEKGGIRHLDHPTDGS